MTLSPKRACETARRMRDEARAFAAEAAEGANVCRRAGLRNQAAVLDAARNHAERVAELWGDLCPVETPRVGRRRTHHATSTA